MGAAVNLEDERCCANYPRERTTTAHRNRRPAQRPTTRTSARTSDDSEVKDTVLPPVVCSWLHASHTTQALRRISRVVDNRRLTQRAPVEERSDLCSGALWRLRGEFNTAADAHMGRSQRMCLLG